MPHNRNIHGLVPATKPCCMSYPSLSLFFLSLCKEVIMPKNKQVLVHTGQFLTLYECSNFNDFSSYLPTLTTSCVMSWTSQHDNPLLPNTEGMPYPEMKWPHLPNMTDPPCPCMARQKSLNAGVKSLVHEFGVQMWPCSRISNIFLHHYPGLSHCVL